MLPSRLRIRNSPVRTMHAVEAVNKAAAMHQKQAPEHPDLHSTSEAARPKQARKHRGLHNPFEAARGTPRTWQKDKTEEAPMSFV